MIFDDERAQGTKWLINWSGLCAVRGVCQHRSRVSSVAVAVSLPWWGQSNFCTTKPPGSTWGWTFFWAWLDSHHARARKKTQVARLVPFLHNCICAIVLIWIVHESYGFIWFLSWFISCKTPVLDAAKLGPFQLTQALRTGTATYRATGRPNANTRLTLIDTFLQYRQMHYQEHHGAPGNCHLQVLFSRWQWCLDVFGDSWWT